MMLNRVATNNMGVEALAPGEALAVEDNIMSLSLSLLNSCLSFDFIGANPDESSEELGTLQVPSTWKDRLQNGAVMRVLFNLYKGCTTGRISIIPDAPPPVIGATGMDAAAVAKASAAASMMSRDMRVSVDRAKDVLECLSLVVSIRRSLFTSETDRKRFLSHILRGLVDVMRDRVGLQDPTLHHGFSRVLSKVKMTYQLEDLVRTDGYGEWVAQLAHFSVESLGQPLKYKNSLPYLLGLWSRLVGSVPYLRASTSAGGAGGGSAPTAAAGPLDPLLDAYVPQVVGAYVRGRIESIMGERSREALEEIAELDALEDELDALPTICRYVYEASSVTIGDMFDRLYGQFTECAAVVNAQVMSGGSQLDAALNTLHFMECRLAWVVAIIGAIVGGASNNGTGVIVGSYYVAAAGAAASTGEEVNDAALCRRVLMLMNAVEVRVSAASAGMHPTAAAQNPLVKRMRGDARLELAFLYFIANFRKAYVSESSGVPPASAEPRSSVSTAMSMNPFSKPLGKAHSSLLNTGPEMVVQADNDMSGVSADGPPSLQELYTNATGRSKVFYHLFLLMNMGDHVAVMTLLINKLANNLRLFPEKDDIIRRTLDVWNDLVYSYASARLLLSLNTIELLLRNHTEEHFPFLAAAGNSRHRTYFYSALARLVFVEDESEKFEPFIAPLVTTLEQLGRHIHMRNADVMRTVIGCARDWRGVFTAANNRANYVSLFEAIYPAHLKTLVRALEVFADAPAVTSPVLKCITEIAFNRASRVIFGPSSANGILLFREASSAIVTYGRHMAAVQPAHDPYATKYKGVAIALDLLTKSLEGGYVNFGVFSLYADPALDHAMEMVFQLVLGIPVPQIMQYSKLAMSYMKFLHTAFRSHTETILSLATPAFMAIIAALREGLDSVDMELSTQAASALDYLATFSVRNAKKEIPAMAALRAHLHAQVNMFEQLMRDLFHIVVFGEAQNQWSLARPMLSLILAAENVRPDCWREFKLLLISSQPSDAQAKMQDELERLMKDVTLSLEITNRDRFAQRLTTFRQNVRDFAKM